VDSKPASAAGSIRGGGIGRTRAVQGHRGSGDNRAAFVGYLAAQDGGLRVSECAVTARNPAIATADFIIP